MFLLTVDGMLAAGLLNKASRMQLVQHSSIRKAALLQNNLHVG